MTLSVPAHTFGFEIEPDAFGAFLITANFYNGSTLLGTVSRTVNGSAGALLAAGSGVTTITSVGITAAPGANGFAVAEFRYGSAILGASVPTLSTVATGGLGMLLAAAGALLARAQRKVRV
jgi:hypothetical protein